MKTQGLSSDKKKVEQNFEQRPNCFRYHFVILCKTDDLYLITS